jgi:SAM-dependent methyltransferase
MRRYYPLLAVFFLFVSCRTDKKGMPVDGVSLSAPTTDGAVSPADLQVVTEGSFEHMVADYESQDRVIWQKPDMVIALLGDLTGKTVADIGAGTGYFSFRLIPKAEKVIAVDIDSRFIAFMDSARVQLNEPMRDRFDTRLAKPNDPMLRPGEVDAVVIVNTYGYIADKLDYMTKVYDGLSPGGQLLIIDFKKIPLPIGPEDVYKVSTRQIGDDLLSVGFQIVRVDNETLDYQYIILAKKPG